MLPIEIKATTLIALCTCEEKISVFIYEIILQRLNNTKFPSHLLDFEILLVIYHVAVCLDSFNNKIKSQQKLSVFIQLI